MDNPTLVAALILGLVNMLFILIGMATPAWFTFEGGHAGLYVLCNPLVCISIPEALETDRLLAVRAFVCLGFLLALFGLIIALLYYFKYAKKNEAKGIYPLIAGSSFLASGACVIIAIIIIATDDGSGNGSGSPGYSFALTLVGGLLGFAAGGLALYHRHKVPA